MATSDFVDSIERIKRDAKRGPLHPAQIKMLKLLARNGFSAARGLLPKFLAVGAKQKKRFKEIVKETPRQPGESCLDQVHPPQAPGLPRIG